MTIKEFKQEYRLICSDTWGNAMEAWFECTGHLNKRGLYIPAEWEYRPAMGTNGTDEESYWYELFEVATDEQLIIIGDFLFRYCEYLRFKGKDY
jgi:hypothetical protein